MSDKALISELTWRSLEMQKKAFPDAQYFIAPEDIPELFRQTRRGGIVSVSVLSLGIIADTEKTFRDFLSLAKKRGCHLHTIEEEQIFEFRDGAKSLEHIVDEWRKARRNGSARIGASISAKNKKEKSAAGIAKIKDRWPQPSGVWPTSVLLDEAGLSLNTVKAALGSRPIAQANYEAAQKRKARKLQLPVKK